MDGFSATINTVADINYVSAGNKLVAEHFV
jgi:hypothetical protein